MIVFKNITVRNFFRYGNYPTTINLDNSATTLVVGKNGRGKSSILLDGVFFALFDKPYRKIRKNLMVNDINKSDCVVELEFETKGSTFTIRRGLGPTFFEIVKDGAVLDSNTLKKDLQSHLEEDILQLNQKTFGQTCILGTSSYVPFMQLEAAKRREVIDDVLQVAIFTKMSDIAKEELSLLNKDIQREQSKFDVLKAEQSGQIRVIDLLNENKSDYIKQLEEELDSLQANKLERMSEFKSLKEEYDVLRDTQKQSENYESVLFEKRKTESLITSLQKENDSIESLEYCSSCKQEVDQFHRETISNEIASQIETLKNKLVTLSEEEIVEKEKFSKNKNLDESIESTLSALKFLKNQVETINKQKENIENKLKNNNDFSKTKLVEEQEKLEVIKQDIADTTKALEDLKEQKEISEISIKLLKDSGIKATVVKEYLGTINSLIQSNLQKYGFHVSFELDENFDEVIKTKGKEKFTYHSFSEGEKEKIDYSIMLALRAISCSKNSAHLNLLILDEILDGSLDPDSRKLTLDILTQDMEQSNVFVISHTENNESYYDRVLNIEVKGAFSHVSEKNISI